MKDYLNETLAIFALIFFLPSIVAGLLINAFKDKILHTKTEIKEQHGVLFYLFSAFIWLYIVGSIFYSSLFTYKKYVFACPIDNSVKCYEVEAETDPELGYTKIIFPNLGHIDFYVCRPLNHKGAECDAANDKDGTWTITPSKTIKVPKYW